MADSFLKLSGINGESLDARHAGEIEVHEWKWGLTNKASFELSPDKATKKTEVEHLTIEKRYDNASVTLVNFCALGKHIPEGRITCRKNSGDKVEYLIISLKDIKVHSVKWPGRNDFHEVMETVQLSFSQFEISYQPQDNSGMLGAAVQFGFDVPTHNEAD